MLKLTMMRGLPASGKSTLARDIVKSTKNCIRVNRDDLRFMFYGKNYQWTRKREDQVIVAEKNISSYAFQNGFNVVVDDTNLSHKNEQMWKDLTESYSNKFVVIDLTTVPIDECIRRDRVRSNGRVGRSVIERMALFNNLLPRLSLKKEIAIFDIDGTLANGNHRLHFITNGKKNWNRYRELAGSDTLQVPVADWLSSAQKDMNIFIVSGRGTDEGIVTEDWLKSNHIDPDRLFMRQGGDHREDSIIKQEILDKIVSIYGKNSISFVVDDRPRVIEMWRKNGLKVFPVNQEQWENLNEPEEC